MTIGRRRMLLGSAGAMLAALMAPAARAIDYPIPKVEVSLVPYKYRRREVAFKTSEPPGTIVVNSKKFYLYYVRGNGRAIRYGIGVGKEGSSWFGEATVARKAKWPTWTPTREMQQRIKLYQRYAKGMPGGLDNPLGARAMYLLNEGGVDNLSAFTARLPPPPLAAPPQQAASACSTPMWWSFTRR